MVCWFHLPTESLAKHPCAVVFGMWLTVVLLLWVAGAVNIAHLYANKIGIGYGGV